jgi:hypothetical protein
VRISISIQRDQMLWGLTELTGSPTSFQVEPRLDASPRRSAASMKGARGATAQLLLLVLGRS